MKKIKIRRKEKPKVEVKKAVLDTIQEQIEKPQTTIHCPESIKEDGLKEVSYRVFKPGGECEPIEFIEYTRF